MLMLPEEFLLLATDEEKGTIFQSASMTLGSGLPGAVLLELSLKKAFRIENERIVVDSVEIDDPFFRDILVQIQQDKKPRKLSTWVQRLAFRQRRILQALRQRLVDSHILKEEERRVLFFFHAKRYPARNKKIRREILNRIHSVVLRRGEPDERTICLLSLIQACNWTSFLFDKEHRKQAKERIKELVAKETIGEGISKATSQAVQSQLAAAVMTVMMTSVAIHHGH